MRLCFGAFDTKIRLLGLLVPESCGLLEENPVCFILASLLFYEHRSCNWIL
jgi:hypothetical protein